MTYFSDFFQIEPSLIEDYGAFNISLINDLPLFIDPFLIYSSTKPEYVKLHEGILEYLSFLKRKSEEGKISEDNINSWYKFSEVKQNWLGYSIKGNGGSGLGYTFGRTMSDNMSNVYYDLNNEKITISSHIEKVGLFKLNVGKDNISDFTCNLIKSFLLEYTQSFALNNLNNVQTRSFMVNKVYFDYKLERWMSKEFVLPAYSGDFVLLTPRDILTKDDTWINTYDLKANFLGICSSIDNSQFREEINRFYISQLPAPILVGRGKRTKYKAIPQKDITHAISKTIQEYPVIIDYFIKSKEENKAEAQSLSESNVSEVRELFQTNVSSLVEQLKTETSFYKTDTSSYENSMARVMFLKDVIENKDGYRLFYLKGKPIKREADLQIIYRLTWYSSPFDVNREVNNGRGPVDYKVSYGSKESTLIEFKLASNSKLKPNLENQVKVYEKANETQSSIKVILYFETSELLKVQSILKELNLSNDQSIVLIDGRNNKVSASNVIK